MTEPYWFDNTLKMYQIGISLLVGNKKITTKLRVIDWRSYKNGDCDVIGDQYPIYYPHKNAAFDFVFVWYSCKNVGSDFLISFMITIKPLI